MGRMSAIFGIAAALAFGACALAQSEPPLRPEIVEQPRYATMVPPGGGDMAGAPVAAPTTPVAVTPSAAPQDEGIQRQPMPRYAAAPAESVTVQGLRQSEDGGYRLGTGDKLRITVFNETDLSGDFQIDGQGFVRLPLIGQTPAAGLTSYGLETRIAASLRDGGYLVNPRVAVEVTTYRPFYIIGEVSKPGEYPYVNAMSVPNAIALAGGYTDRAVMSTIYVRHQGEREEHEMSADETTRIRPGDVVRVGRTAYWTVMTMLAPLISPFSAAAYLLK
jgi:protein involved in polysaccharide export with SLBB domain